MILFDGGGWAGPCGHWGTELSALTMSASASTTTTMSAAAGTCNLDGGSNNTTDAANVGAGATSMGVEGSASDPLVHTNRQRVASGKIGYN